MIYIVFFAFLIIYFLWIGFRIFINHPIDNFVYIPHDIYFWFKYKKYNNCPSGILDCYTADFGKGKTLSAVHRIMSLYKRYNDKVVWDPSRKKFVTQKIIVLSNVEFKKIPYYRLTSLSQIVNYSRVNFDIDKENDTLTVTLILIDEASVQLNSRSFKSNIDPTFLNTLLTERHYRMNLFYTSQKFNLTDKLMRDVTQSVIQCKKFWRIQVQIVYDAHDVEAASSLSLINPIMKTGFYVHESDYAAYDTLAVVDQLQKAIQEDDMLSSDEILALRGYCQEDDSRIRMPSKKLVSRRK